ncbi:MAG: hypothetical protein LBQ93_07725 [Treponema sp.]|nr:hypothetical protein [Treponema sp.]
MTAATFALVMSIGLGLIAGVSAFHIFLRALLFTVMFFAFGSVLRLIITYYFPEFMYVKEEAESREIFEKPGSRVNITVDTSGEYAVPELYKTPGDSEELGNIDDLISGYFKPSQAGTAEPTANSSPLSTGIDRYKEEGYNVEGDLQSNQNFGFDDFQDPFQGVPALEEKAPPFEKPAFTPSFGDDSDDLGGLPDLDSMAMAFSPVGEESVSRGFSAGSASSASDEEFEPAQSYRKGNKPQQLKGDFDPKELAKGISTVLSKDK